MNFAGHIILIERKTKVACAVPVCIALVVILENCKEMLGVCFVDVLDTKIVDNKCEADGSPLVPPKTWCDCAFCVACLKLPFC